MKTNSRKSPLTVYLSFADLTAVKSHAQASGISDSAWIASQIDFALQLTKIVEKPRSSEPEILIVEMAETWLAQWPEDLREAVYNRIIGRRYLTAKCSQQASK
jgi:hypothetical protein